VKAQGKKKLKDRYLVSLKKDKTKEPLMSQMTFMVNTPLESGKSADDDFVSFAVVKNDEFNRPGWFLRELKGKLYVEKNDNSGAFASSATFKVQDAKWKVCPGKTMCSGRGACVNVQQAKGTCQCGKAFTGKACEGSVLKVKIFASSGKFDFYGAKGPDKWSKLDPKWKVCRSGKRQSPVAFSKKLDLVPLVQNQFLSTHYKKSGFTIERKGKDILVKLDAKGQFVNAGGFVYDFSHFEFSAPGEHAVPAQENANCAAGTCAFDAEVRLVHTLRKEPPKKKTKKKKKAPKSSTFTLSESKGITKKATKVIKKATKVIKKNTKSQGALSNHKMLIIAIPFKIGVWPSKFLKKLLASMPERDKNKKGSGSINLMDELPQNPTYYRYLGSLTKPPCTEDVLWYVFAEPLECAAAQIQKFYTTNSKNARLVQKLNGRKVSSAFSMEQLMQMMEQQMADELQESP